MYARLVMASVAIFHFVSVASGGHSEQLVSKADAKDGLGIQDLLDVTDGLLAHLRVSRPIAQEKAIKGRPRKTLL